MKILHLIHLALSISICSCRIYIERRKDDPYSLPLDKTDEISPFGRFQVKPQNNEEILSSLEPRDGLLSPHIEVLQLIETFLRFKGEVASRFRGLLADNADLLRSLYMTVINKLGSLHSFTVTGIQILRKILEVANNLMAHWQISLPSVSFGIGNQQGYDYQY